jgi:transcriptional regulator, tetR family
MPKIFSDREKENIVKSLLKTCKQSWTQYGYKKTSVDELCRQVGISKGAFYIFFDSKEALFCEVLFHVQKEIYDAASQVMDQRQNRSGVAEAIKLVYREYAKNNFLYNSDSTDFTILTNKLSEEQLQKISQSNEQNKSLFLEKPYLHLKIDADMAISVIYALIMSVKIKDTVPNHLEVFDFMVDHLIDDIYE